MTAKASRRDTGAEHGGGSRAPGTERSRGTGPPQPPEASLEALVETGILELETLHPGGHRTTRELVEMCRLRAADLVLDVAGGTGETALRLAESRGSRAVVLDASPAMTRRAREKARGAAGRGTEPEAAAGRSPSFHVVRGDAHRLPFADGVFDVVLSECTLSLLRKGEAVAEMRRVARPGGRVGFHELAWKPGAPRAVRERLVELEGERPETAEGWGRLLDDAGVEDVEVRSRPGLVERWMEEQGRSLGLLGRIRALATVLRRWGPSGVARIRASERLFRSEHLGYALVAGRRPEGPTG